MIGVALLDFGGPQGPDELVPFLTALLEDVLPGPTWLKRYAAPAIANARAKRVRADYERIGWSPLVPTHERQADALRVLLGSDGPPIVSGMMFTEPSMTHAVEGLLDRGVTHIIALPLFPHYSLATTNAAFSFFHDALIASRAPQTPVHWVGAYPTHPSYIGALANTIRRGVQGTPGPSTSPVHLLFTPHGLPLSFLRRGDPYPDHIRSSVRAVLKALDWKGPAHLGWQSRVGPVKWLTPGTPEVLDRLGSDGVDRVCLVPISFASEHIETLHEIDIEYREHATAAGIAHFGRAPALGTEPQFIESLAQQVRGAIDNMNQRTCVRCMLPERPRPHKTCPNCQFETPAFLRESR